MRYLWQASPPHSSRIGPGDAGDCGKSWRSGALRQSVTVPPLARTDYNAGNAAEGIPSVHYHLYEWAPGKQPMETASHIPGEYPGR